MMVIKTYNKNELIKLLDTDIYHKSEHIPISIHRAKSQISNPHANDTDVILICTYFNTVLTGYLGILPDNIYDKNQDKYVHCGWMSCLWVHPEYRGKKIAQSLIHKCFEVWDGHIILTEYTGAAGSLYEKSDLFQVLTLQTGVRLYNRASFESILPPKHTFFQKTKSLLKFKDRLINSIFDIRFLFYNPQIKNHSLEFVSQADEEIRQFILQHNEQHLFKRNLNEINWILQFPWVLNMPEPDQMSQKYHFTSGASQFCNYALKVRNSQGKLEGFFIFTNIKGHLKMPYCFHKNNLEMVKEVIEYMMIKLRVHTFTTYQENIAAFLIKKSKTAWLKREVNRPYLISQKLHHISNGQKPEIQDGDGDCAFT
ncbi:MAG: GNAT family N-acetyltransferase [Saprospiraceae bacterium]|nr:GNAT family N-acetyltransferase [Saprospiraceae bacterium]